MCQVYHTSSYYRWVYAYGLVTLGLVCCPVADQILEGSSTMVSAGLTTLATLEHLQGLVSTAPNWSQAASRLG